MSKNISPEATYLVSADAPGDSSTVLNGDVKWFKGSGLSFGGSGFVNVPAVHFQDREFSFAVWVKPAADQKKDMYVYSDWTATSSFRSYLEPVEGGYGVSIDLRREVNRNESMVVVEKAGLVKSDEWSFISVSWEGEVGICKLFINGRLEAEVMKVEEAGTEVRIQANNHKMHEVGVKLDSLDSYFVGQMKDLSIAKEPISHFRGYEIIGYEARDEVETKPTLLPFQVGHAGTLAKYLVGEDAPEDDELVLEGDAMWSSEFLILSGKGNIKIPAVHFQDHDFTFGMWINPNGYTGKPMTLYSDWTQWWSFMFNLVPVDDEEGYELRIVLRRDIKRPGRALVRLSGGFVKPNEWSFVAVSWEGKTGLCKLFVNGRSEMIGKRRLKAGNEWLVQRNNHKWHDIGMRGDSKEERFVGRMSGFFIMKGAVDLWN